MKQTRIPELDGLRALMIFLVSWYHIWQQSWLTPYVGQYSLDYLRCFPERESPGRSRFPGFPSGVWKRC